MYQLNIDLRSFLAEHWHKKPTVIKAGFADFVDPISPEELAGLTMEEEVDSRFISNQGGQWSALHGPLPESHFESLSESHWQLIVQACNHWHLGAAELIAPFKQLPQWLFDDLMVCYSAPKGGVGPHIDQYDVFIIQGSGKRRWRVGAKDTGQYNESIQASALRQIEGFDAIIDEVLMPGDILYIPPGFPHEGNTIDPSMSYSIGFRSPKEQELLSNFADYVLANDIGDVHLHNPELSPQTNHGEIQASDEKLLTEMLKSALNSPQTIKQFLGEMLSQSRHQLDVIEPEQPLSELELRFHFESHGTLCKVSGLKALYHQDSNEQVFINGEVFNVEDPKLVHILCNSDHIDSDNLPEPLTAASVTLLTELVNKGYWYLD